MIKHDSKFAYLYEFILGKGDIYTFKLKKVLIGEIDNNNIFYESGSNDNYISLDKYLENPEVNFNYYQVIDFRDNKIYPVYEKMLVVHKMFDYYKDFYNNVNIKTGEVTVEEIQDIDLECNIDEMYSEYVNLISTEDENKLPKIDALVKDVLRSVKFQDGAVKDIISAIYMNYKYGNIDNGVKNDYKANIFIHGPSGVGKTYILKVIAKHLNIPIVIEDMTRYTVAGYKGADIENIFVKLVDAAGGDVELAQKGIVVFNEIDKKLTNHSDSEFNKDVINDLLCILEGSSYSIIVGKNKVNFNTNLLTTVSIGALANLYSKKIKEKNKQSLGFNTISIEKYDPVRLDLSTQDLLDAGFSPEYIGRLTSVIGLKKLVKEDLYNLLIDIETSPLMKYYAIAGDNNVDLHIDYNICEKIAEKALELNTGARSLDGIVSNLFSEIYYILECYNDVTSICIYDITEEDNKLKLVYSVETKNVLGISKVRSAQN